MWNIQHAPVFDDFPVLAAPPVAVAHEHSFASGLKAKERFDVNARDHRPSAQKRVVPVTGFSVSTDTRDAGLAAITPSVKGLLKRLLKCGE